MKLIDADLLKDIPIKDKLERNYQTFNLDDAYEEGWFNAIETIEKQSTVECEEITHCEDCIFGYRKYYADEAYIECTNPDGLYRDVNNDSYCSAAIEWDENLNPCRGCEDYITETRSCGSKGGCGADKEIENGWIYE